MAKEHMAEEHMTEEHMAEEHKDKQHKAEQHMAEQVMAPPDVWENLVENFLLLLDNGNFISESSSLPKDNEDNNCMEQEPAQCFIDRFSVLLGELLGTESHQVPFDDWDKVILEFVNLLDI